MTLRDSEESHVTIFDNPKRSCTDWPCLIIFIAFLILYILFAAFVFREGSIRRFITPTDSQGRMCGVGSQHNRPYLQFFNIIKCIKYILIGARCPTPQMCVAKCPSIFYHYKLLYAQELKLTMNNRDKIPQIRAQLSVGCVRFLPKSNLFCSSAKNSLNPKWKIPRYPYTNWSNNGEFVHHMHFHQNPCMVDVSPRLLFKH